MSFQEAQAKISQVVKDIEELKVQGATAVAESSFQALKLFLQSYEDDPAKLDLFLAEFEKTGLSLVNARQNEPLARNGLKFVLNKFKTENGFIKTVPEAVGIMTGLMDRFMQMLVEAKSLIVQSSLPEMSKLNGIMTHCHSTTVENLCIEVNKARAGKGFSVVATETRPMFQGRTTATNLFNAGVDVKLIIDAAVASFLVGDWNIPVDAVLIGCDEILSTGDVVNKVGSYAVALSAYHAGKPLYVFGTMLKMDPSTVYDRPEIEMRDSKEVWAEAPAGLKIVNPAFEVVPHDLITGFITERGIVKPEEIERAVSDAYGLIW